MEKELMEIWIQSVKKVKVSSGKAGGFSMWEPLKAD